MKIKEFIVKLFAVWEDPEKRRKLDPLEYAAMSALLIPVGAAVCLFAGVTLLLTWPVIPFVLYYGRKRDMPSNVQEAEVTTEGICFQKPSEHNS